VGAANGHADRVVSGPQPACIVGSTCARQPASGVCPLCGDVAGLVGRSPAMRHVFEQITRLATGSVPVLIAGETGTGKELIARAIHERGPRRAGPMVAVNCAALPRDLIESELFGYKRGAFNGAATDHLGLLRAAAGGTVLLDEITEMSPELQAKLLRAVQEHAVRPIGSIAEVPVDVRFIASSNRDVDDALRNGLLRPDLYYRLSVGMITVPPLRERGDDLALLAQHYVAVLNQRYGISIADRRVIDGDAIEALRRRPWLGNVRELFNVLERTFIASRGSIIRCGDFGVSGLPSIPVAPALNGSGRAAAATYAQSERAVIEYALSCTGGNKARAARQLGISRKKLYARIASYARVESVK
jgi:DNA-binding NtrC family response regulator